MISASCFSVKDRVREEHVTKKRKDIKLIKYDGGVTIFDRPIKALQLMEQFPKHLVCRSDSFYLGQKTAPLSHHDRLQLGHNYFLLPADFFQTALSFASFLRCRSTLGAAAFEIEKTPSGSLRIKVSEEYLFKRHHREPPQTAAPEDETIITTPQLKRDYEQLVVLARLYQWKPKLETIAEKKSRKKRKN